MTVGDTPALTAVTDPMEVSVYFHNPLLPPLCIPIKVQPSVDDDQSLFIVTGLPSVPPPVLQT
jgi:hypothetical protein